MISSWRQYESLPKENNKHVSKSLNQKTNIEPSFTKRNRNWLTNGGKGHGTKINNAPYRTHHTRTSGAIAPMKTKHIVLGRIRIKLMSTSKIPQDERINIKQRSTFSITLNECSSGARVLCCCFFVSSVPEIQIRDESFVCFEEETMKEKKTLTKRSKSDNPRIEDDGLRERAVKTGHENRGERENEDFLRAAFVERYTQMIPTLPPPQRMYIPNYTIRDTKTNEKYNPMQPQPTPATTAITTPPTPSRGKEKRIEEEHTEKWTDPWGGRRW